ncbi:MAG: alanine dehydrogenase, partial [Bacteroidota bacterium]|nr:alanine dehydrogenase [Bacteroidota bacterium]
PYTSTIALTNATLTYAIQIAGKGWHEACRDNKDLRLGLNVISGDIVYEAVSQAFGLPYKPVVNYL